MRHRREAAGVGSVRGAVETLGAHRIRHGVRVLEDPGLAADVAARGIVLDVCPVSNLRLGVVTDLADHPLPALRAAGLACSLSTDDPAMFDTDLGRDHAVAAALGVSARDLYEAGVAGALCDEATRSRLAAIGAATDWAAVAAAMATAVAADPLAAAAARRRGGASGAATAAELPRAIGANGAKMPEMAGIWETPEPRP
jgi:aminodeoxyfutalosine deaminase